MLCPYPFPLCFIFTLLYCSCSSLLSCLPPSYIFLFTSICCNWLEETTNASVLLNMIPKTVVIIIRWAADGWAACPHTLWSTSFSQFIDPLWSVLANDLILNPSGPQLLWSSVCVWEGVFVFFGVSSFFLAFFCLTGSQSFQSSNDSTSMFN